MNLKKAIKKIEERGMLLVFPINNKKDPPSIWYEFFPKTTMRWEWDDSGDSRVADLWHLREELSRSRKVVYGKWFRGRATFFSRELFSAMLCRLGNPHSLSTTARQILSFLEDDSPLSSKALKKMTELQGRALDSAFQKALKELWTRLLIVGFGEIDDGAFPSLAIGATDLLFDELSFEAKKMDRNAALKKIHSTLKENLLFLKEFQKVEYRLGQPLLFQKKKPTVLRGSDLTIFTKK